MDKPLISFVLPTYNRVAWVSEAIQGLLMQTVKNIEVIVVDDNSTDRTKDLLEWFTSKDRRVRVLYNVINMGAGLSRNAGNAMAQADIIGVCDSDDIYPDNRAKDTLDYFEKHPDMELVNGPYCRINYFSERKEDFLGEEFDEKAFKEKGEVNYFAHPTASYLKKAVAEVGGYKRETETETDDYQFLRDWVNAGKKVGFAGENYLAGHRVLPNSIMARQRGWRPEWVE